MTLLISGEGTPREGNRLRRDKEVDKDGDSDWLIHGVCRMSGLQRKMKESLRCLTG